MKNGIFFCLCLEEDYLNHVKTLNYIPVGLGDNEFNSKWIRDNVGENISYKNKHYGPIKDILKDLEMNLIDINELVLKKIPELYYDVHR